ncbi:TRAP transporter substrate-binding protein [Mesorhizobium sp. CAU 1732]|uniref:TRAP transporter substrate-binding protein n=1 Tax=Mesorhizobium sp. CAU 1732 TaxID=3140358 RepID=UPI0032604B52
MKIATVTLSTLAACVAFTGFAQATERWRVPLAISSNLPGVGSGYIDWAETLNAIGGDHIQVRIYDPGEIVPAFGVFDAVRDNRVPAGLAVMNYSAGTIPAGNLLTGVPFGLGPSEYAGWYYTGGGKELTQDLFNKHGVHGMLCLMTGPETGGWFRNEVSVPDDIRGLKFRTAGPGAKVYEKLGASVTALSYGETFSALERGLMDAVEASIPSVDIALGLHKVTKHAYFPGWQQPVGAGHLVVNLGVWNGLTDIQKALVEAACDAAAIKNIPISDAVQAAAIHTAVEAGVQVHHFSEELLVAFEAASNEVLAEEAAADADFKAIYESMEAYKAHMSELGPLTGGN